MTLGRYPLFQQAYLVNDLDKAILSWNELLRAGPFVRAHHHKTDRFDYRGTEREADVFYAFGYLGTFAQWRRAHELWQPGDSPFLDIP